MILNAPFPPDIRVEKEASTLLSGHELFLLCTRRRGEPASETWNGIRLTRVFGGIGRRVATWRLLRTCRSDAWRRRIDRFVEENGIEVLHVHDLPLAGTALESAREHGLRIVLDLHEDYPALLETVKAMPIRDVPSPGVLSFRILPSIRRWREYERNVVRDADALIVVTEEAEVRMRALGVEPSRVHVVPNYAHPVAGVHDRTPANGAVTAIYIGGFDQARDLRTVLDAADILTRRGDRQLRIELVGGSARQIALLRRYASRKGLLFDNVSLREWVDRNIAEEMVSRSQIGLVPHVRSALSDSTIPHKLLQYMAAGLPVVVSDCPPIVRVVSEAKSGVVYEAGNAGALADCLARLAGDPEGRRRMGASGAAAVEKAYNWDAAARVLLTAYWQS